MDNFCKTQISKQQKWTALQYSLISGSSINYQPKLRSLLRRCGEEGSSSFKLSIIHSSYFDVVCSKLELFLCSFNFSKTYW